MREIFALGGGPNHFLPEAREMRPYPASAASSSLAFLSSSCFNRRCYRRLRRVHHASGRIDRGPKPPRPPPPHDPPPAPTPPPRPGRHPVQKDRPPHRPDDEECQQRRGGVQGDRDDEDGLPAIEGGHD